MAKEKIKENTKKRHALPYEVIGLILLATSLIIWEKLGTVGFFLNIGLKLLFGNWSFIIIIYLFILGIRSLFFRKLIDIHASRSLGLITFLLSLMLLSNQKLYAHTNYYDKNPIIGCIKIFEIYLKDLNNPIDMGGGIVGMTIYHTLIFLLGNIGTILVSVVILLVSIILISNNNFKSFCSLIITYMKKIWKVFILFFSYIKKIKPDEHHKKRKISINMLNDTTGGINEAIQKSINNDCLLAIECVFKKIKVDYTLIGKDAGYTAFRCTYSLYDDINVENFKNELLKLIESKVIIRVERNLIIEFNNRFRELLTLKNLLLNCHFIPLIKEIDGRNIEFSPLIHQNILITGDYNSGVTTFIEGFIASYILKEGQLLLAIVDKNGNFQTLRGNKHLFTKYENEDITHILDKITLEIEKRLDLLKYLKVNSYIEANKELKEKDLDLDLLSPLLLIINELDISYDIITSKLLYLAQLGSNLGIHIIYINRTMNKLSTKLKNIFPLKMLFKVRNISQSLDILDNDDALFIERKGEVIMLYNDERFRGQTGFISHNEFLEVINA